MTDLMINNPQLTEVHSENHSRETIPSNILSAISQTSQSNTPDLTASWFNTPIGQMIAIADAEHLLLLEFEDCRGLEKEISRLTSSKKAMIVDGSNQVIDRIKQEIELYFAGKLKSFKTPIKLTGTEFQKQAWLALQRIPYGETRSYLDQAKSIGHPKAHRAIANANGANQLAIIVPCHRIIRENGDLGGYGGGISRKAWLLDHEKKES